MSEEQKINDKNQLETNEEHNSKNENRMFYSRSVLQMKRV